MTLQQPANASPSFGGIGGVLFNLIDVVQGYTFDPGVVKAVSRKTHTGVDDFEIDLPLAGPVGIESRSGQGTNADEHQVVVTFLTPVTISGASVTGGTGSVSGTSIVGNEVRINLTGIANEQTIAVTLFGVNDGTGPGNVVIPMGVLRGDVNASRIVTTSDVNAVRAESSKPVTTTNFRTDVNASGVITTADVNLVRAASSTTLD